MDFGINWVVFCIPLAFNVFDIVSGLVKAWFMKAYSSTKIREGLMHKCAFVIILVLAAALQVSARVLDFGFELPSLEVVAVLIVIAECVSILENVLEMNPHLEGSKLFSIFSNVYNQKEEEEMDA